VSSTDKASNATGSGITSLSTSATNHTAGKAYAAFIRIGTPAATVSSVTNTAGDTWTACTPLKTATIGNAQWWYVISSAGNSNDIVTANFDPISVYASIIVVEITGIDGIDVCSGNTGGNGAGTSVSASSFSTSYANEVILQGAIWGALSVTATADTGYTAVSDLDGMGGLQYKVVSSTQSGITPTLTISSSQDWIVQTITLRSSASSGSSPRRGQIF
jgi:hypothetical protein